MKRNVATIILSFTISLTAIFINHSNKKDISAFANKNKELKIQLQQIKDEETSLNQEKTKLLKDKENIEKKINSINK